MKTLITGSKGMLGRTIVRKLKDLEVIGVDLCNFDIVDAAAVKSAFDTIKPAVVVHCAAQTAVDACESSHDSAFSVNAIGTANVAHAANIRNARLIYISTDYVFSGDSDEPYVEWDAVGPLTVYGRSKLAGEEAVRVHCPNHAILRIAWLYGQGGPSFYHTMKRLGGKTGEALRVVNDQVGNPTSTDSLVPVIRQFMEKEYVGTFHTTCEGEATWYEFTKAIFELTGARRDVIPCSSQEYPRPAPRPRNSRLENMAMRLCGMPKMPHWRQALTSFVEEYPND